MQLSYDTIQRLLEPLMEDGTITDTASEYGEPGYDFPCAAETPMFLIGNWWCRCGHNPHAGQPKGWDRTSVTEPTDLHDHMSHHPRLWAQLESQGVETAFNDEWWIDYNNGSKAYRTQADSYQWQSSIQWNDDIDDYMTPDSDISDWVDWARNDPTRALMQQYSKELPDGWFEMDRGRSYGGLYESGWHPGQTDDPVKIAETIPRYHPDHDYLFVIDETSQFYIRFSVYLRPQHEEEET